MSKDKDNNIPSIDEFSSERLTLIDDIWATYAPEIDSYIQKKLVSIDPTLSGMISYHFGWVNEEFEPQQEIHGKRFRAIMSLLTFQAAQGVFRPCIPLAACIEMVHNFSLIHDDIEDEDEQRRGKPTVWKIWGKPLAINAGDLLHVLSYAALSDLTYPDPFNPSTLQKVYEAVFQTTTTLTVGQHKDIAFEKRAVSDVTVNEYLDMIYGKSASLIEGGIWSSAILGLDRQAEKINNYRLFGRNIGMAFQIRDDIIGVWGNSEITGKTGSNDVLRKKKTYPILYGFKHANEKDRKALGRIYSQPEVSSEDAKETVDILTRVGAYEHTQQLATHYYLQAVEHLHATGIDNEPQQNLLTIGKFLFIRNF